MTRSMVLAAAFLLMAGCASTGEPATPTVSWQEAIEILKSGKVDSVFQTHSRVVTLIMKDGSELQTREPSIDLVFDVIDECGAPCADIAKITE